MVIVICATFSHIQQLSWCFWNSSGRSCSHTSFPSYHTAGKHPCTSGVCSMAFPGKHHCTIPWIFNSSCFNRLEMQGHVIAKVSLCHCSQHCPFFISLHCSSTPHRHCALPTGKHSPIQVIQLLMQNTGTLGRRTLHPHSRAPQLS